MEYAKITEERIETIEPGTKVNFGHGEICEIVSKSEPEVHGKVYRDGKFVDNVIKMIIYKNGLGEEKEMYSTSLLSATEETLDPTIEKCTYCGKLRPRNEMKSSEIFVNRGRQTYRFCRDGGCSGYYQMGCEG
ncbi:MAG: hypothetical protein WC998_01625 [Candidatus Paceibacterota bacterium]|jgi:hypothetical protein